MTSQLLQQLVTAQQQGQVASRKVSLGGQLGCNGLDNSCKVILASRLSNDDEGGGVRCNQQSPQQQRHFLQDTELKLQQQQQMFIQQQQQQQQQSSSVLMNLLVSGCDVSAGYVCLTKTRPSKGGIIASK